MTAGIVILCAITITVTGYFYSETYLPTLRISADLSPPYTAAGSLDPTILQITVNLTRVQVHSASQNSQSGWYTVMEGTSQISIYSPQTRCCLPPVWSSKVNPGAYNSIRLNITTVIVNIANLGNVSYTVIGGGFVPILDSGSFLIFPSQIKTASLHLTFSSTEIHALNGRLTGYGSVSR